MPPPEILLSEDAARGRADRRVAGRSAGAGAWSCSRPSAGRKRELVAMAEENAALALQTPPARRAATASRWCWRSSSARSACPGRRTASRASTSPRIQGRETVASMVVWQDGDMKKDDYKRYKIRTVIGTDDFASMQEVLTRRYGRALESEGVLPDLILLDGGRGQLGVGAQGARGPRPRLRPDGRARQAGRGGLHAGPARSRSCSTWARPRCRRSRRSATRRTASRSPTTRSSASGGPSPRCSTRSPGWGRRSARACSRPWARPRAVREASVAELASVPKITPKLAQRIHDFFHPAPAAGEPSEGQGG